MHQVIQIVGIHGDIYINKLSNTFFLEQTGLTEGDPGAVMRRSFRSLPTQTVLRTFRMSINTISESFPI